MSTMLEKKDNLVVINDASVNSKVTQLAMLQNNLKTIQSEKEQLKEKIKEYMSTHDIQAMNCSEHILKLTNVTTTRFNSDTLKEINEAVYNECVVTKTYERFIVK